MKVMVIGGGGREHAIVSGLRRNPDITELYVLPGNAGMREEATVVPSIGAKDIAAQVAFAKEHGIDFAVVAPDDPLVLGAVDALEAIGIPCFGPRANAAIIEGSKIFSKNLMKKYGIPTAAYEVFEDVNAALAYVKDAPLPTVIKADGLALGKGVILAYSHEEAEEAVRSMMEGGAFGASGARIVVEEFLTGPEVSVLAFTDGNCVKPMVSSMDHKRALDNDEGLNTGGMGTVAPNPYYTSEIADICMETIFLPTIRAMKEEGRPFKGCLYFGLMLTPNGPKVIEYNCRFGDPETQVVLPLLKTDLFEIFKAVAEERLEDQEVEFEDGYACCVIQASTGYPGKYETGFAIQKQDDFSAQLFVAGAKAGENGELLSAGGRVLGVTAKGATLQEAIKRAYEENAKITFGNAYYRQDIGRRALAALEETNGI